MDESVTLSQLQLPLDAATARNTFEIEGDSKEGARLRAALFRLAIRFKARTIELEIQVNERRKAEQCLRELTSRVLQLQDEQARQIARELHDSTGQYLAAIQMNLNAMGRDAAFSTAAQATRISESIEMVTSCTTEIRTLSYLLHPPLLDEMGLVSALKAYSDGFSGRSGIRVELDISPDFKRLPAEVETAMFRIVQQSLANVHRHSGSKTAKITIREIAGDVAMKVSDEGCGMDPEVLEEINSGTRFTGVGTAGMRERTKILNGHFRITSSGAGTAIEVSFPIP